MCPVASITDRLDGSVGIIELDGRLTVNDQPGMLKEAVANIVRRGARNEADLNKGLSDTDKYFIRDAYPW